MFRGFAELKRLLLEDRGRFLDCLVEKLLVYATGNRADSIDPKRARTIADDSKRQGAGLADLVRLIVASDQFVAPVSATTANTPKSPRRSTGSRR